MEFRKQLGDNAEETARQYLEQKGYRTVQKNFRCKTGEIDLIMQKEDYLIFVEVRSRSHNRYGEPLETVEYTKQKKIKRASKASRDENTISKIIKNLNAKIKNVFYSPSYFEKLGLEYVGPIDGHDIEKLEKALS